MSMVEEHEATSGPSLADAPFAWVSMDDEDRIVGWNDAAEALLGWRREEVVGAPLAETLIPPAFRADHHAGIGRYRQTGETILVGRPVAVEALHREGGSVAVEMLLWINDVEPGAGRYHAVFRPAAVAALDADSAQLVAARYRRLARELENHQAFLDAVLAHQSDPVVACDAEGNLTVFNDAARVLHGKEPGDEPTHEWARSFDLLDAEGRPMSDDEVPLARALRGEVVDAQPMKVGLPGGPVRDLLATGQQLRGPDGEVLGAVVTMRDVTESLAAQRRLEHAADTLAARNDELEDANRFKVDLIGMLGHEVRTPLTSITGYAEILSDVVRRDPDAVEHLRVIRRNAKRLDTVVRNVLAMVAAGAGGLAANRTTFDVCTVLQEETAEFHDGEPPEILCDDALVLHADQSHVEQILTNLLSNASKYGGGAALVEASAVGGDVEIRVTDRGDGVPVELQEELFDRFTRAEAMAHRVSGSGLGLHIARELARANGGDLRYEHQPGAGATFVLRLPGPAS